jgi:hypothetical protein
VEKWRKVPRGERWAKLKLKDAGAALRAFFLRALVSSFLPRLILWFERERSGERRPPATENFSLSRKMVGIFACASRCCNAVFRRFIFHCAMKAELFLCLFASPKFAVAQTHNFGCNTFRISIFNNSQLSEKI